MFPRGRLLLPQVVVVNLDAEDGDAAYRGDKVGDKDRPQNVGLVQQPLQHEGDTAYTHHHEGGQGYIVGLAGAYGANGLWQVAEYHADACHVSTYII